MHIKTKTNIPKYQAMIIISPLIQLVNDQVRPARLPGISIHYIRTDDRCEEQRKKIGKNIKDGECRAPILFICCPETFTSDFFQDWLKEKTSSIVKLIFDEVHQVLACTKEYREDYGKMLDFISSCMSIVIPYGSLTMSLEKSLLQNKISNRLDDLHTLKVPNDRPNIFHMVKHVEDKKNVLPGAEMDHKADGKICGRRHCVRFSIYYHILSVH
jgi:superfamily II DNA helicase RecQ